MPEPNPEAAAHLDRLHHAITTRDDARQHVFDVIREIIGRDGVKQADIVRATGWTREYIRKIVKNDVGGHRSSQAPASGSGAVDQRSPESAT